jgi:hypothetical protein
MKIFKKNKKAMTVEEMIVAGIVVLLVLVIGVVALAISRGKGVSLIDFIKGMLGFG